jgi:hypothetical protein
MAKAKKPASEAIQVDERLKEILKRVRTGNLPSPTIEEEQKIPFLWPLISPSKVEEGDDNGNGRRVKGVREPILMLAYDRRLGSWSLTILDRLLEMKIHIPVTSPLFAIVEAEEAVRSGNFRPEKIEKRLTKLQNLDKLLD